VRSDGIVILSPILDYNPCFFDDAANNVIGAMPDVTYKKNKHLVGEQTTL
jgi:hypothetical protein